MPETTPPIVAILDLPRYPPSTERAHVTFVSMAPENLVFNAPDKPELNNNIGPSAPIEAYATYTWDTAENVIKWTVNGGSFGSLTTSGSQKVAVTQPSTNTLQSSLSQTPTPSVSTPIPNSSIVSSDQQKSTLPLVSSNTTTPIPSAPSKSSDGLKGGAVAGIAIGCLVSGAVIAGLLVWFCLGRARRRSQGSEASTVALMHREKGTPAKMMSLESGSPTSWAMDSGLPQPLEDRAISGEIAKISSLIKNHVQSFYHTGRVSPGLVDIDDLQALGSDLPITPGMLSTLLGNSATREIALRFCIAWVVVSHMQLNGDQDTTFLPPEIAKSFQSMAIVGRGPRAQAIHLAKWRAITAELMQSTYVKNAFSTSDPRHRSITMAADVLDSILRPFADSRMGNEQRRRNLEEILKRSALFAFTLFSQPSIFDFDWQREAGVTSGSLCVFPALLQVADESGEPVKPPRSFNDAIVRRLDE